MQKYENYFKNNHSYGMDIENNSWQRNKQMDKKFGRYIKSDAKVLEIWSWLWSFANFCIYKWVKEFVWIEIDQWVAEKLSKYFDQYKILCADALEFFEKTEEKFDVIFMSHVLEHFTIEDGITLARHIREHLNPHGIWINIMPNAWCISSWVARYNDITHKVIYTSNSFNQLLLEAWFDIQGIQHFNVLPSNPIKKLFFWLAWKFLSVEYNTFELMSVIRNKS